MAQGPRYRIPFHRRSTGQTDYRARLALLKSRKTRLVVRRSLKNVIVQFVDYDAKGDRVRAEAESRELKGLGWDRATANLPAAYLTGLLAARRAKAAGVEEAVLDIGRQVPQGGGVLFAALRGVVEADIDVPHGDDILPADERVQGAHIGLPEGLVDGIKVKIQEES